MLSTRSSSSTTSAIPSGIKRRKVLLQVSIISAYVKTHQPLSLKVKWQRGDKSIDTKTRSVDEQNKVAKFEDKFKMASGNQYDFDKKEWVPNLSKLILFADQVQVGVVTLDLASYIDQRPIHEKAYIAMEQGNLKDSKHLVGDVMKFPESYVKFQVKVETIKELPSPSMEQLKSESKSKKVVDAKKMVFTDEDADKANQEIQKMKFYYNGAIEEQKKILEEVKVENLDLVEQKQRMEEKAVSIQSAMSAAMLLKLKKAQIEELDRLIHEHSKANTVLEAKLEALQELEKDEEVKEATEEQISNMIIACELEKVKLENDEQYSMNKKLNERLYAFEPEAGDDYY